MKLLDQKVKEIKQDSDIFNFFKIIDSIENILEDKNEKPIIGLFGEYGEGKGIFHFPLYILDEISKI